MSTAVSSHSSFRGSISLAVATVISRPPSRRQTKSTYWNSISQDCVRCSLCNCPIVLASLIHTSFPIVDTIRTSQTCQSLRFWRRWAHPDAGHNASISRKSSPADNHVTLVPTRQLPGARSRGPDASGFRSPGQEFPAATTETQRLVSAHTSQRHKPPLGKLLLYCLAW